LHVGFGFAAFCLQHFEVEGDGFADVLLEFGQRFALGEAPRERWDFSPETAGRLRVDGNFVVRHDVRTLPDGQQFGNYPTRPVLDIGKDFAEDGVSPASVRHDDGTGDDVLAVERFQYGARIAGGDLDRARFSAIGYQPSAQPLRLGDFA